MQGLWQNSPLSGWMRCCVTIDEGLGLGQTLAQLCIDHSAPQEPYQ